jgi:hypothetical protein
MPRTFAIALLALALLAPAASAAAEAPPATGVTFEAVAPERWVTPARGQDAKFDLGLRITNSTAKDLAFSLFDTVRPVLATAAGKELPLDGGRDGTRIPKPLIVKAGQTGTAVYPGTFSLPANKKHPRIVVNDQTGGVWVYHDLAPGAYTLAFEYRNDAPAAGKMPRSASQAAGLPPDTTVWTGRASTAPIKVVVEAAAETAAPGEKAKPGPSGALSSPPGPTGSN